MSNYYLISIESIPESPEFSPVHSVVRDAEIKCVEMPLVRDDHVKGDDNNEVEMPLVPYSREQLVDDSPIEKIYIDPSTYIDIPNFVNWIFGETKIIEVPDDFILPTEPLKIQPIQQEPLQDEHLQENMNVVDGVGTFSASFVRERCFGFTKTATFHDNKIIVSQNFSITIANEQFVEDYLKKYRQAH